MFLSKVINEIKIQCIIIHTLYIIISYHLTIICIWIQMTSSVASSRLIKAFVHLCRCFRVPLADWTIDFGTDLI